MVFQFVTRRISSKVTLICLFGTIAVASGCSDHTDAKGRVLVDAVSGTVTMDGKGVYPATVEFWLDNQAYASPLDESGRFEFGERLPAGQYMVTLAATPPAAPTDDTPPEMPDIPQKYLSPVSSDLTAEVKVESDSFSFELKPSSTAASR